MAGTRRKPGLLGPHYEGYRCWLEERGYTPLTVRGMLKVLGQVGRWLSVVDLDVADLSVARLETFRVYRRQAGFRQVPGSRALRPLLTYLSEIGVVHAAGAVSRATGGAAGQYRDWLVTDRGLAEGTVLRYETTARRFLSKATQRVSNRRR